MAELAIYEDIIEEIASRLDLRQPNRDAILTINARVSQWYDVEGRSTSFEAVVASATGVGKTYILAGAMELFAQAYGVRDFVIVTPGRTILNKTVENFTAGGAKSLLGALSFQPFVITAENFNTPVVRATMDDDSIIKLYGFTVQSLTKPSSKTGKKTHKFQEGLGEEFYSHLQGVEDLVVFADEHHTYYGKAFSDAVRALSPWVLVGLTATPHKNTPDDEIIFRYPLAAAIADKLVKTPVIVGRKDDRDDMLTKVTDGVTLLNTKDSALEAYAQATGAPRVNPVMLLVAKDIADAEAFGDILRSSEFFGGAYADFVLVVHSDAPDKALELLSQVEDPQSSVRIIISVGMLKEGWDVKNVYVIASMRPNVSEILTEQTLGRGMRLPFGHYTDIEILDTLEVVAHERYQELLKKAGVLNQAFIDYRTWATLKRNAVGQLVAVSKSVDKGTLNIVPTEGYAPAVVPVDGQAQPAVTNFEDRSQQAGKAAAKLKVEIAPNPEAPTIQVPILKMTAIKSNFSLADISEYDAFWKLGRALATDPEGELNRTLFSARVVEGPDGIKRTELIRSTAVDRIKSAPTLFPLDQLVKDLGDMVLASSSVPARANQRAALKPLIDSFLEGLGDKADEVLSANLGRAGAMFIRVVLSEQRRFMPKPQYEEVVELLDFHPTRATDKDISEDHLGPFLKSMAYSGWKRAIFPIAWFDSEPERHVANMVDDDDSVKAWVRLNLRDLPILWNAEGANYNPDLIVIDNDDTHWIVETKMDKEIESADVLAKREAARRWANHVNAEPRVIVAWRYILVSETDIRTAKESWGALKGIGF